MQVGGGLCPGEGLRFLKEPGRSLSPTSRPVRSLRHAGLTWIQSVGHVFFLLRVKVLGFPGGSVLKNPPADAGHMGSIPDPGRSHTPWSN